MYNNKVLNINFKNMSNEKIILPISGMTCASCAMTIEKALNKTEGVVSSNVNIATEKATIEYDTDKVDQAGLVKAIENTGYGVDEE